ncbi:hypothetical protein ACIBAG_00260 [Streptomyces sp. NPDC051243]|uniref:hypothetical protein n=1 Tax=Streptomyces sp. NPDC051243 TaxID=3365646 RepID=UPI0037B20183
MRHRDLAPARVVVAGLGGTAAGPRIRGLGEFRRLCGGRAQQRSGRRGGRGGGE